MQWFIDIKTNFFFVSVISQYFYVFFHFQNDSSLCDTFCDTKNLAYITFKLLNTFHKRWRTRKEKNLIDICQICGFLKLLLICHSQGEIRAFLASQLILWRSLMFLLKLNKINTRFKLFYSLSTTRAVSKKHNLLLISLSICQKRVGRQKVD